MSELANQELRTSQNPPNQSHLDHRLAEGPGPPNAQSLSSPHNQSYPNSLDERPVPQGSSGEGVSGSYHNTTNSSIGSGTAEKSSKRREGRREASRTRHVSGSDSRRPTSTSRYNSYSSDEQG